jgi:hypothetical protein
MCVSKPRDLATAACITVARGIALYGGFGEVPNVGSRKCKKPKNFMAFEGLRHHLNVL